MKKAYIVLWRFSRKYDTFFFLIIPIYLKMMKMLYCAAGQFTL